MDSPSTSPVAITCENSAELSLDDKRNNANMVAAMKASRMAANATRKAAKNPKEGLINSPQMRDTIALCRGFIHAADVR